MANIEFTPPIKGINRGVPADRPMAVSSEYMNNVRPAGFEKRIVICQRLGLGKWGDGNLIGSEEQPVVAICTVASVL